MIYKGYQMEVKAISNSQPSFNGYLGRNIQTYVHNTMEREVNSIVKTANAGLTKVDGNEIRKIKDLGSGVLKKLSDYVEKMNKKIADDILKG